MKKNETRTEFLARVAATVAGRRYNGPVAAEVLNAHDWAQHWPVVDGQGRLTGAVIDSDGCRGMANVADLAMVRLCDLPDGVEPDNNGYVTL